ncbi:MAG: tripartite tricarboxylate transporter permease [Oscillospiraceae bacterium]
MALSSITLTAAPTVARYAVKLGTYEMFSLGIFSLTMICVMTEKENMSKGIGSGLIGVALGFVGMAPMDSVKRLTFGIYELDGGFNILSMLIGIFVVSEIILTSEARKTAKEGIVQNFNIRGFGFSMKEFIAQLPNAVRSALIGLGIGILPGIGGGTSNILAYTVAKGASKYPEKFGTGILDGVVASETANNATIGGALVPLLTLGIPGDTATAMLIGGFMIHGITPGPMLLTNQKELVYAIFASLLISNFLMLGIEFFGLRAFVRLLKIPKHILMPIILVMCAVGAFCLNNRIFDVKCVAFFGIGGYLLTKVKIPLTPIILGFILGTMIETNFRRGLQYAGGNGLPFITRPISALFLLLAMFVLIATLVRYKRKVSKITA